MFENWPQWAWVSVAWLELLIAYGGYLLYLRSRARRLEERD